MKTLVVLVGSIVGCQLLMAQPTPPTAPVAPQPPVAPEPVAKPTFGQQMQQILNPPKPPEVRFDLNFPGGTPAELIQAIEKASNHPVNAVIPNDLADMQLPPLKMKQVTVAQLFEALMLSSLTTERYLVSASPGSQIYNQRQSGFGFKTKSPDPNAVWYFYYDRLIPPANPPAVSRFYNLDTAGKTYTIQDITTAIKTGWDLLGVKDQPTLKYHPETKLLIAVGQHEHLQLIDSVLRELGMRNDPTRLAPTPTVAPKKDGDSPAK